jgi:hypothetical protein
VALGQNGEAEAAFRRALEIQPDDPAAQFSEGLLRLRQGDFERGWPLYEKRWEAHGIPMRDFPQPRWRGEPLEGKRILVYAEQGLGDSIQFIRYAPWMAARGGAVIVEAQPSLAELFREVKGVCEVVAAGEALPDFDVHVPMLSLPLAFGTRRESIPREVPYLRARAGRLAAWERRVGGRGGRFRVGLIWASSPENPLWRIRDVTLEMLRPVLAVPGVEFFSLQLGVAATQFREETGGGGMVDLTAEIRDFADSAALMAQLDLVISVDTAPAHLAGALGRPVWTLLPFSPDWRWGSEGETTPWYPTMRLFRQTVLGEWGAVVERVAEELRRLR